MTRVAVWDRWPPRASTIRSSALLSIKSDDVVDAIGQCLETMRQHRETLAAGRLQLGLGASDPRGPLEQLQRLTEITGPMRRPRRSSACGCRATAENVRTRHTHVKNAIVEGRAARRDAGWRQSMN